MSAILSVALYARVSSQRQAEELTILSQVEALRELIKHDGHVVDDERCFLDEGFSGGTLLRPALERLRDLAHSGGIDLLYVHSPDRLARNYVYQMVLLEEFTRYGVKVIFINDDPQQPSAERTLLVQVQSVIAEYERAKILERTRRGRRYAAKQGKISVIGHAPYGYRYVTKAQGDGEARYDVVMEQAQYVRSIFHWVGIEGLSLRRVVDRLAEQGLPTPTGKARWDMATVRGILLNPAYTGTAKYGKTRMIPRVSDRRPKRGDPQIPRREKVTQATSPDEQESISVPALISTELFQAVSERLQENRSRSREQKQGSEFLLSGLLICHRCRGAYCGRRVKSKGKAPPYIYYRCLGSDKYRNGGEVLCRNKSISGAPLDEAVWSDVCSLLQDSNRLERELERRMERPPQSDFDSNDCQKSIDQLKRRLSRLLDAYENGWLERDEFESRSRNVKLRLTQQQKQYEQHQQDAEQDSELRLIVGHFEAFAEQIKTGLTTADFATKRAILKLLIRRIEIDEDEVRIVYKVHTRPFAPSPVRGSFLHDWLKSHIVAQGKPSDAVALAPPWVNQPWVDSP